MITIGSTKRCKDIILIREQKNASGAMHSNNDCMFYNRGCLIL